RSGGQPIGAVRTSVRTPSRPSAVEVADIHDAPDAEEVHAEPSTQFAGHGRDARGGGFASTYLPHMLVVTAFVMLMPVVVVWTLHSAGVVSSPWIGALLAVALSFAASLVGRAYWTRRGGSEAVVFSDLLLWGWLRRVRTERQVRGAI